MNNSKYRTRGVICLLVFVFALFSPGISMAGSCCKKKPKPTPKATSTPRWTPTPRATPTPKWTPTCVPTPVVPVPPQQTPKVLPPCGGQPCPPPVGGQCNDQRDNDGDGLFDWQDPGCWHNPNDPNSYDPTISSEGPRQFVGCYGGYQTPIRHLPGIIGVRIYERSMGVVNQHFFGINDQRLCSDTYEGPARFDFVTSEQEYYDLFISHDNGGVSCDGSYLTIESFRYSGGGVVGFNLDAVSLVFADGGEVFADAISRVKLGTEVTWGYHLASSGYALNVLGVPDGAATAIGNEYAGITVGFCSVCSGSW